MNKLISMTDFVLEQAKLKNDTYELSHLIIDYANFLKQSLTLGMFVPCDEDGKALKEPEWWYRYCNGASPFMNMDEIRPCQEYKKAKERILFKGFRQNIYNETGSFEIRNENGFQVCVYKALPKYFLWLGCPEERTVESAIKFHDFYLTPTAQKQLS